MEIADHDSRAPDFAEAIEAWRVWSVVLEKREYRLASVFTPVVWPVREPLAATCLAHPTLLGRLRRRPPHPAPDPRCECGIYATSLGSVSEFLAALAGRPEVRRVVGRVALWGDVVECERGYRASYAYPLAIFVLADGTRRTRDVVGALSEYGRPVELVEGRCGEVTRELARRVAA